VNPSKNENKYNMTNKINAKITPLEKGFVLNKIIQNVLC
jgi:hypothetical protein